MSIEYRTLSKRAQKQSSLVWILVTKYLYERLDYVKIHAKSNKSGRVLLSAADRIVWDTIKYNAESEIALYILNRKIKRLKRSNKSTPSDYNDDKRRYKEGLFDLGTKDWSLGKGVITDFIETLRKHDILSSAELDDVNVLRKEVNRYMQVAERLLMEFGLDMSGEKTKAVNDKLNKNETLDFSKPLDEVHNQIQKIFAKSKSFCEQIAHKVLASDVIAEISESGSVIEKEGTRPQHYSSLKEFMYNKFRDWARLVKRELNLSEEEYSNNFDSILNNFKEGNYDIRGLLTYSSKKAPKLSQTTRSDLESVLDKIWKEKVQKLDPAARQRGDKKTHTNRDLNITRLYLLTQLNSLKSAEKSYVDMLYSEGLYNFAKTNFGYNNLTEISANINQRFENIGIISGTEESAILCSNPDCHAVIKPGAKNCSNCGKYAYYGKKDPKSPLSFKYQAPRSSLGGRNEDEEKQRRADFVDALCRHFSGKGIGLNAVELLEYFFPVFLQKRQETIEYIDKCIEAYQLIAKYGKQLIEEQAASSVFTGGGLSEELATKIAEKLGENPTDVMEGVNSLHQVSPIPFLDKEWSAKSVLWIADQIRNYNSNKETPLKKGQEPRNLIEWCLYFKNQGIIDATLTYWVPWNTEFVSQLIERHKHWSHMNAENIIYESNEDFCRALIRKSIKMLSKGKGEKDSVLKDEDIDIMLTSSDIMSTLGIESLISDYSQNVGREKSWAAIDRKKEIERIKRLREAQKEEVGYFKQLLNQSLTQPNQKTYRFREDPNGHKIRLNETMCWICGIVTPERIPLLRELVESHMLPIQDILDNYGIQDVFELGKLSSRAVFDVLVDGYIATNEGRKEEYDKLKIDMQKYYSLKAEQFKVQQKIAGILKHIDIFSNSTLTHKQINIDSIEEQISKLDEEIQKLSKSNKQLPGELLTRKSELENQLSDEMATYVEDASQIEFQGSNKLNQELQIAQARSKEVVSELNELELNVQKINELRDRVIEENGKNITEDTQLISVWLQNMNITEDEYKRLKPTEDEEMVRKKFISQKYSEEQLVIYEEIEQYLKQNGRVISIKALSQILNNSTNAESKWSSVQEEQYSAERPDYKGIFESIHIEESLVKNYLESKGYDARGEGQLTLRHKEVKLELNRRGKPVYNVYEVFTDEEGNTKSNHIGRISKDLILIEKKEK